MVNQAVVVADRIDDYLAFCDKRGEAPDKPFSSKFLVRIDSHLHPKLDMIAKVENKSLNTYGLALSRGGAEREA